MRKTMLAASLVLLGATHSAVAQCVIAEPSPTHVYVRHPTPYALTAGPLSIGQKVLILGNSEQPWVYVADEAGNPLGLLYRSLIVCKGDYGDLMPYVRQ